MSSELLRAAASAVLYVHFAVVVFNVFWIVAIPLGAWRGWNFVRSFWWRGAHVIVLAVVALQAVVGALCFLTIWQNVLLGASGDTASEPSVIETIVTRLIFWPLPLWAFVVIYIAAFGYTLAMWWLVPPYRHPG
jgi:hypothetical protein